MNSEFYHQISHLSTTITIAPNQILTLQTSQTVWIVKSGEIALFRVNMQHGTINSSRRYLFSCEASDLVFVQSFVQSTEEPQSQLLAVSIVASEVFEIDRTVIDLMIANSHSTAIALVCNWHNKCQAFIEKTTLNFNSDSISLLNQLTPTNLDELTQQNTQFLYYLDDFEVRQQVIERKQFQQRGQYNQQISTAAIAAVAKILTPTANPDHYPSEFSEQPSNQPKFSSLYEAVQRVAQASGITINLSSIKPEYLRHSKDPLQAIANMARFRVRRVLLTDQWWRKDCGSLLAYTRENNCPVALIAIAPGRYTLFDPEQNRHISIDGETRTLLSPIAYMFYRPFPERTIQLLSMVQFGLNGSGHDWRVVFWTGVTVAILGLLLPQATAILIDRIIPDANRSLLIQLSLGLLLAVFGGLVFQLAQGIALMRIETRIETSTQAAMWDRVLNLGAPFFRHYSIGDLRDRISIISTIRTQISGAVLRSVFTSLFTGLNLILLVYYGGYLAWFAGGVALLMGTVTLIAGHFLLRKVTPLQSLEGKLFGLMVQLLHGITKLRVAGSEERAFAHWGQQYCRQQQLKFTIQQIKDNLFVFNQVLLAISLIILFSVVAGANQFASIPHFSTGTFLAFNVAFGSFILGLSELSNTVLTIVAVMVLGGRAKPILQANLEVDSGKIEPGQLSGRVLLDRVTFRYQPNGSDILQNVSIVVHPGEFVAIVGPSGSGKSTLFRLLLGFETPQAGQIYYDGHDLRGLNIHSVRRQLGVLIQNSRTMTASIFDNIAGNALITMDEAWEAAQHAGLANEIEAMPMGMHTIVSEGGSNLSGGQRQRLMIARSLALKPRILLFDEATSSLDNRTQAIVSQSLDRLKITRIVIAHRLSTIQNADRIYVLQDGQITQQGCFQELMNQEGLFVQLMQKQMI